MPAGDAQRAWFPEMISELKNRWYKNISWDDTREICRNMQVLRDKIRKDRNIKPVKMYCKKCEKYTFSTPPPISIRSLLFALRKSDIITEVELKAYDKEWKKYKRENNLDPYGNNANADNNKDFCLS